MKIFRFFKKMFFVGLTILSSLTNAIPLSCVSRKNQECKTRPQVISVNSNNPIFYPFNIKTSKCQELMKQDLQNGMKHVSVNVD